jgi:hypothetical protein
MDVRISSDRELTHFIPRLNNQINPSLPSFPNWRVRFGAKLALNQPPPPPGQKPLFASSNGRLTTQHKTLEKQLTEERRKTETAEEELSKIRDDRKRMEAMLARLRSLLNYGKTDEQQTNGEEAKPEENPEVKPDAKPEEKKPEDNQQQ